jgi:hypothetical protein
MPELHRTPPAQADYGWAPSPDEMERMALALDRDRTFELHGPEKREYAICLACAHGYHDAPGPHELCACACHGPHHQPTRPVETPRKQIDLREFYTNPIAFGMKLALRRAA